MQLYSKEQKNLKGLGLTCAGGASTAPFCLLVMMWVRKGCGLAGERGGTREGLLINIHTLLGREGALRNAGLPAPMEQCSTNAKQDWQTESLKCNRKFQ